MKHSLLLAAVALSSAASAQTITNKKDGNYKFTVVKNLESLEVQNQNQSGTCWTFSSLSFFESELIRMGKPKVNLSEMFIVRKSYPDKADKFVRMHGLINFGPGGAFHDVAHVIEKYGIVPQEAYSGFGNGEKEINHNELDAVLRAIVETIAKSSKPQAGWKKAIDGTLDGYLGKAPENFTFQGKQYTPKSYAQSLGLDMKNYVEISSFTHHPFYAPFQLEVQDNWAWGSVYNLPLDEMMAVVDNAIMNGYPVAWAADVSEKGFSFKNGVAVVPAVDWSEIKKEKIDSVVNTPGPQMQVTQEMRQEQFDNYETQDDHGMHITGIVKDQNGTKYYIVKNSWGVKNNDCDGYFYASEAYVKLKTTGFMIHKDGIKKDVAKKMGL